MLEQASVHSRVEVVKAGGGLPEEENQDCEGQGMLQVLRHAPPLLQGSTVEHHGLLLPFSAFYAFNSLTEARKV